MQSTLTIVVVSMILIMLPIWLLAPPILKVEPVAGGSGREFANLSEPAAAGGRRFGDACAECHGRNGDGGETAPSLLNRVYASDFRDVPSFHDALQKQVPEHQAFLKQTGQYGRLGFNERELLAKFLREMRRLKEASND